MFTGIIQGCGVVRELALVSKKARRLSVTVPEKFPQVKAGGSIAVNGACLTVTEKRKKVYFFDVVLETFRRTNFSGLKKGSRVNLEPALRRDSRIEGHFVQGHVDAVGRVSKITRQGADLRIEISFPVKLKPYFLEKGSVTVNGVSLTIGKVQKSRFSVYLIPHTLKLTNFDTLKTGDRVNLEADLLLKFFKTLHKPRTAH